MKITALRLFNVKRFAGRGVAIENIGDGVNVLCAANEFGKSTSFEALHALFFQPHTSTAGDVRALRPYSGGNPLVEVDVATGTERYRITKQFYGGRSARVTDLATGRLMAQADEAENFIAGLTRGGTAGPAGLLWVRQGVTGIEKRTRSEEDSEKQVRASLLESVQGEVEAVTGGRRMAEIMAVVDAELDRLVTPTGRPKAGERYAAAINRRDELAAQESRLAAEVVALRQSLDGRAAAWKRLAELERVEDREARRKDIEAAQGRFDTAKALSEKLRGMQAELKLACELRDSAAKDLASYRAALAARDLLRQKMDEAGRKRGEAVARRDEVARKIAQARHETDLAETDEREKRAILGRLNAALKAREAAERLAEMEGVLAAAEATRKAVEEDEAALALLRLPEGAIAEVEALDIEIAKLRAVAEAGRPSVFVAYQAGAPVVCLDGEPLADGEPRSYGGQAELLVPGVGTVTLRAGQELDDDGRLATAEARRDMLLASMEVENLTAARQRQFDAHAKESDLREGKGRLSLLAPNGLQKLLEDVKARQAMQGDELELKGDPLTAGTAHSAAEQRLVVARQALREVEPQKGGADTAFVAAETALASLMGESTRIDAVLGAPESRMQRERELADRQDAQARRTAELEAEIARLDGGAVDLDAAAASLSRLRSIQEAADKEIAALRETVAGLAAEIRARSDDAVEEKWREASDALDAAKSRVGAFEKEVAILQRLRLSLETARSHARDAYLRPILSELHPLLGLLFDDATIGFDEKTLLPETITRRGHVEDVERLSGGMREQLSVLTRLAFARLLAKDGRPAPVILDDALVYSDDDRIEKMFDALHRQARDQQIIVFSCRQRAFQRLGGRSLTAIDWFPAGVTTPIGVIGHS